MQITRPSNIKHYNDKMGEICLESGKTILQIQFESIR